MKAVQETGLGIALGQLLEGILDSGNFPSPLLEGSGLEGEKRGEVLLSNLSRLNEIKITGLSTDSQQVQPGNLFMACVGVQADGRNYIKKAINNGAVAVLAEARLDYAFSNYSVPVIKIPQLAHYVGLIAARFYGEPSRHMKVVGFTGTNGKTSCTQFLAQALAGLNTSCGIIGTLGTGFLGNLKMTGLTTPDAVLLQRELSSLQARSAEVVAMEVSSHGLSQGRIQGVRLDIAVFTNLTVDHLDYHQSMDHYALAKKQLFLQPGLESAVFNMDDPYGRVWAEEFRHQLTVYGYRVEGAVTGKSEQDCARSSDFQAASSQKGGDIHIVSAQNITLTAEGFEADVVTPWGMGVLSSTLLGRFNISNLLAVLTVLGIMGIPLNNALKSLTQVKTVAGRMERFGGGRLPLVVIDYAHTSDALEKTLLTLREYCHRKLWCVFGCGGDRDSSKRQSMGRIAEQYSDQLIITDDNPRFEDAEQITQDIVAGLLCPWAVEIEHDRETAIAHAIQSAVSGDIVLIAGKGHEDYQLIGHNRLPFSDAEQVRLQLSLK